MILRSNCVTQYAVFLNKLLFNKHERFKLLFVLNQGAHLTVPNQVALLMDTRNFMSCCEPKNDLLPVYSYWSNAIKDFESRHHSY